MTLPLACPPPASCSSSTADPPTVPPRKRRRRAPASGASDDCFACTKRNIKCDRRRPYCSQCLEVGKECSGYKTQLTWGVGVASRGKLRGLSLPVARSAPAPKSPPRPRPRTVSTISKALGDSEEDVKVKLEVHTPGSVPGNPFTTYDFVNMAPHGIASPPLPLPEWNMAIGNDYHLPEYHHGAMNHQRRLQHLHRLHTLSLGSGDGLNLSSPIDSMSAYGDSDYASPMSQSFQLEDIPFPHSPVPMYNNYSSRNSTADQSPVIGSMMGDSRGPTSCPEQFYAQSELSSSISSHQNLYDIHEGRQHQASPSHHDIFYDDDILGGPQTNDMDVYATSARSSHFGWNAINDDDTASQTASEPEVYHRSHDSMSSSYSDMSPRVSFFLDYYEKIICPSVVVIDSPSNPYREHILSLAASSQSLQHAICALSACNLRMKRKQSLGQDHWRQPAELDLLDRLNGTSKRPTPARRTSNNPMSPEAQPQDSALQEEYRHRSLAVSLLNQQLSDPAKARNDAVLATLFILCHYRMCESGIAQFRTQFAGVKKILGMRESGAGNWGWMESLFTYFDGIAASINDRESQLRGGFLEMIANPGNNNHALENLAGCDSILFKTIGKLGRLNLLSQHRPVQDDNSPHSNSNNYSTSPQNSRHQPPPLPSPRPKLAGQALVDFYNLHAHNFDGNGFASTIDDDDVSFPNLTSTLSHDDLRATFWSEWKSARLSLQEWEFDAARLISTLPTTPTSTQLRDFGYISEAFRYAALLYTERLAFPNVASSHLTIQNLVSQVLFYVTSLEPASGAEKFLLWPLFICGSECVNELQQSIVRQKCREIMGRSGYLNNLAGLEVLESVWAEKDEGGRAAGLGIGLGQGQGQELDGEAARGGWAFGRPPFRWSRYMEGVEGEWIMF